MTTNFDPNVYDSFNNLLIGGSFTSAIVIDPSNALSGRPNLVIPPGVPLEIDCTWHVEGPQRKIYLENGAQNWQIEAFAETMGPGVDYKLGATSELDKVTGLDDGSKVIFRHRHVVNPHPLPESNPSDNRSGVYKIVVTCFLNSKIPGGYDLAGFYEGPMIHVESLE